MPNLLIALAVVFGGIWLIRKLARTPQQQSRGLVQKIAGGAIIAFAGLLALRGQMNVAVAVFLFGAGLMGKGAAFPNGFGWGKRSPGQKSSVATTQLSMELDHDTGAMNGTVLAGPFKGRLLSELSMAELQQFHMQCQKTTDQSQALLESWLDRTQGEWRAAWGNGASGGRGAGATSQGAMSRAEALAVLGLNEGATAEDVKSAHKRLMKDFHPDRGGSDYLAAKINAAKDVLLGA